MDDQEEKAVVLLLKRRGLYVEIGGIHYYKCDEKHEPDSKGEYVNNIEEYPFVIRQWLNLP